MKRRIDVSQLNELTDEQRQKLREWWKPELNDFCTCNKYGEGIIVESFEPMEMTMGEIGMLIYLVNGTIDGRDMKGLKHFTQHGSCLPLLSISQMIELLQEKQPNITIERRLGIEYGWNIGHYRAF
jgi:hypothetical protein